MSGGCLRPLLPWFFVSFVPSSLRSFVPWVSVTYGGTKDEGREDEEKDSFIILHY